MTQQDKTADCCGFESLTLIRWKEKKTHTRTHSRKYWYTSKKMTGQQHMQCQSGVFLSVTLSDPNLIFASILHVCVYECASVRAPRQASFDFASRVWPHMGLTQGSLYKWRSPLPLPAPPPPRLLTASCHNHQMPPPMHTPTYTHTPHPLLLCQAVVAASVASSVTGEVPCYYGHCCRSATLWLCSRHQ